MQRIWRLFIVAAIAGLAVGGCKKKEETPAVTGRWGYIDKAGDFIIQPQFDEASDFSPAGDAFVRLDKRILRLKAKPPGESSEPVKPEDSAALAPSVTLRAASGTEDGVYIIMDGSKCVFDVSKGAASDDLFKGNDYVCVKFNDKYAFIDKAGKLALGPFDNARNFSEGRAAVQDGHKWGFMGQKHHKFVVLPKFIGAGDYSCGLAPVEIPGEPTAKSTGPFGF